jgi:hypothetical protein
MLFWDAVLQVKPQEKNSSSMMAGSLSQDGWHIVMDVVLLDQVLL